MGGDWLIAGRDAILNGITGVSDTVLNAGPLPAGQGDAPADSDIAAALKRSANKLKNTAVQADGYAVNYSRLRGSEPYAAYRAAAARLRAFDPASLVTREARLAFWVNLYNALVIDAVLAFEVQRSVTEGWLGILAFFRRAAYTIGGQRISLEDIEHGILRANRGHPYVPGPHFASSDPRRAWALPQVDPRIHFALNCASHSCPPIGHYDAARIDAQLDLATQGFLQQSVIVDQDRLAVSQIMKWYAVDFDGLDGVVTFLREYLPEGDARTWLDTRQGNVPLVFHPYDWALNTA
jgi:hypothetical protein